MSDTPGRTLARAHNCHVGLTQNGIIVISYRWAGRALRVLPMVGCSPGQVLPAHPHAYRLSQPTAATFHTAEKRPSARRYPL